MIGIQQSYLLGPYEQIVFVFACAPRGDCLYLTKKIRLIDIGSVYLVIDKTGLYRSRAVRNQCRQPVFVGKPKPATGSRRLDCA